LSGPGEKEVLIKRRLMKKKTSLLKEMRMTKGKPGCRGGGGKEKTLWQRVGGVPGGWEEGQLSCSSKQSPDFSRGKQLLRRGRSRGQRRIATSHGAYTVLYLEEEEVAQLSSGVVQ